MTTTLEGRGSAASFGAVGAGAGGAGGGGEAFSTAVEPAPAGAAAAGGAGDAVAFGAGAVAFGAGAAGGFAGATGWGASLQAAVSARPRRATKREALGAAIAVFEPDHVVQLRGRDLDDVTALVAGDHPVPGRRDDAVGVAAPQDGGDEPAVLLHHQLYLALGEVEGLVLLLMILEGEGLAGVR